MFQLTGNTLSSFSRLLLDECIAILSEDQFENLISHKVSGTSPFKEIWRFTVIRSYCLDEKQYCQTWNNFPPDCVTSSLFMVDVDEDNDADLEEDKDVGDEKDENEDKDEYGDEKENDDELEQEEINDNDDW